MQEPTHLLTFALAPARWFAAAIVPLFAIALLASAPAQAACPNEAVRETQTSESLPLGTVGFPACMALEMVSPPKKFNQEASELTAFSPDGQRAVFRSKAALADTEGLQTFHGDFYVASRSANGWQLSSTSPPHELKIKAGGSANGGPYAFSPELDRWNLFGTTQKQMSAGETQFFSGGLSVPFGPLSPLLVPIDDSGKSLGTEIANTDVDGTSADATTSVFGPRSIETSYLPDDPRNGPGNQGFGNSYVVSRDPDGQPSVQLLARDKDGVVYGGRCGTTLGDGGAFGMIRGAVSADGSRIFFSTRPAQLPSLGTAGPACDPANPIRIMRWQRTPAGPEISELVPGEPSAPGDDLYQGASLDGERVYFATPRDLAATDQDPETQPCGAAIGASKGCDLYLYDAALPPGERVVQVSAGEAVAGKHELGKGADVLTPIIAVSSDGSHVYFVAQGVLTADQNPEGDSAEAGKPNLYLYDADSEQISFVATLASDDSGSLWGTTEAIRGAATAVPMLGAGPEDGADGHILLFASKAPLSADDADTGLRDVFRYDSEAETLERLSTAAVGGGSGSPAANADVNISELAPSSTASVQRRWASEDGETVAFATSEPLAPGPEDGAIHPYLWKEGQLVRLPGVINPARISGYRPSVSAGGEQVGFVSSKALVPQDGDTAIDVYVARVDGGFPNPAPPLPCDPLTEGACQGPSVSAPVLPAPATPSFSGPGNQKPPRPCAKRQVRKRGKCVKRASRANKKQNRKRARKRQGGQK